MEGIEMSASAFLLEEGWQFREVHPQERADFAAHEVPQDLSIHPWKPAEVPGCVHLDLMRAGRIQDPFLQRSEDECGWVETQDWVYRTVFEIPSSWLRHASREEERIEITFESLETFAGVYLNGQFLAESANQFLPLTVDVTDYLQAGENMLLVHFESATNRTIALAKQYGRLKAEHDPTRVYARRSQFLTGWNMAPRVSGCGILGAVAVHRVSKVRFRSVHVPISLVTSEVAQLSIETELECLAETSVQLNWEIEVLTPIGAGTNYRSRTVWTSARTVDVRPGRFRYAEPVSLNDPVLWWPAGYGTGRRTLYRACVRAFCEGEQLDEKEAVFGLRQVELITDDENAGGFFHFRVNGHPVFARGAIWVPPDPFFPRVCEADYRRWVDMAADAQINMLRVWGGGVYEREAFYRRCDELGILVWQDFMFSRGEYPDFKEFWRSIQDEATFQIKRLRNHPCLVLWCGNDSKEWGHYKESGSWRSQQGSRIFSFLLPHLCREHHPSVPYWRSSPFGGEDPNSQTEGDHHEWEVWDGWESPDYFGKVRARFVSSFGFQALPGEECISEVTSRRDLELSDPAFEEHQRQEDGNVRLFRYVIGACRPPKTFDELVYMSQWVQSEALKRAVNCWRANRPETMGTLVWHLNDCWPAISWSLLDHRKRPKLGYWGLRQAYSPVSVILLGRGENLRVTAVHDGAPWDEAKAVVCRLRSYELDGRLIDWRDEQVRLPPNGRVEVGQFSLRSLGAAETATKVVVGEIIDGDKVLASNMYCPVEPRRMEFHEPKLTGYFDCLLGKTRAVLLIRADIIVRGVEIRVQGIEGARVRYENGFDIWPSREVWVQVDIPSTTDGNALFGALVYRCLNDVSGGRRINWRELPLVEGEGRARDTPEDSPTMIVRQRKSTIVPRLEE